MMTCLAAILSDGYHDALEDATIQLPFPNLIKARAQLSLGHGSVDCSKNKTKNWCGLLILKLQLCNIA